MFRFDSPFGAITYDWDGQLCHHICLHAIDQPDVIQNDPVSLWLDAYFKHKPYSLPPLAAAKTPFQAKLRVALHQIPQGKILTYGELAKELNSGDRAVGQALGANPLPIVIPCHRIVASAGLGGFACGLAWKKSLLQFEGVSV